MITLPNRNPSVKKTTVERLELTARLKALDLGAVNLMLILPDDHGGRHFWTEDVAEESIEMYRRFLFLKVTADFIVIPTREIDVVWHLHMADTEQYQADCLATFGFFLHHFPYLGLRGPKDKEMLTDLFRRTAALYEVTFGDEYRSSDRAVSEPSDCG